MSVNGVYILSFSSTLLEKADLLHIVHLADKQLRAKNPVFTGLMDAVAGSSARMEISNLQYNPVMHSGEVMKTSLAGWVQTTYNLEAHLELGSNFFPHGMKDAEGNVYYVLFFIDQTS